MTVIFTPVFSSASNSTQSIFCEWFGWVVKPIGYCENVVKEITVETSDDSVIKLIDDGQKLVLANSELLLKDDNLDIDSAGSYLAVQSNGVSEELLNQRIVEVLQYINHLAEISPQSRVNDSQNLDSTNDYVTKDYVLKSLDKVYASIGRSRDSVTVQSNFTNPTLTDAVLNGVTYTSGWLGVGTTSPTDVLSVNGPVYLASVSPTNVFNRLYNVNGDLYWSGSILTSSSTGNWTASLGDVFRLTGNVGIGTDTPTETLTVSGSLSAGTTTARIYDTGGQVCNVEAYGAVGDNLTDNYTAIMATINACPEGGIVYFPMGQYRISQTIVLDKPVTLRGSYAPRWSYSSNPRSSIRAAFGSFVGNSIIHVRDRVISGEVNHNNGGRFENITIDGGSWGTNIVGVYFEGLVRDWKLTDVDITQTTGNGFEAAVGTGSGNPRGFTIRGLSIYSADGHGFRATALNDSYIEDLLSVGNALRGIYISSMGETKINNSRAVFNGLEGLYIDGASNNGGLMFTDFSTDRNDRHGVRISLTGTTTVTFNGLLTRRDGANLSGGLETPYAGVAVIGAIDNKVAPVFINGLTQIIGVDDSGNPPLAPLVGVRVTNSSYVKVEGQLWGVDEAYLDGGGNSNFIIEEESVIKIGNVGVPENPPPLYNKKWVAATNTKDLFYDGRISIGSTTGTRLLNIIAPEQAGARFLDTTNNVTFDMRAEDFQAFFGTFSNHQLRFQTNNTSRLTIDINGYVGIGTTSPDQALDVIGTIQSSSLLGGAVNLTTDANGNIIRDPSDIRLKTNITEISDPIGKILGLRGVSYEWKDKERFGEQIEIGFIAQEVDEVVPEVVRKGGDYWSLNTRNLLAIVVEGMKEMWKTVTGNSDKIADLENRVLELEAIVGNSSNLNETKDELELNNDHSPVLNDNEIDRKEILSDDSPLSEPEGDLIINETNTNNDSDTTTDTEEQNLEIEDMVIEIEQKQYIEIENSEEKVFDNQSDEEESQPIQ